MIFFHFVLIPWSFFLKFSYRKQYSKIFLPLNFRSGTKLRLLISMLSHCTVFLFSRACPPTWKYLIPFLSLGRTERQLHHFVKVEEKSPATSWLDWTDWNWIPLLSCYFFNCASSFYVMRILISELINYWLNSEFHAYRTFIFFILQSRHTLPHVRCTTARMES